MRIENYRYLAGLIAAHEGRKVVGRTRLQKEVKLLQSLGFPTDYSYTIHFYGPYSEGLFSDIGLLEVMDWVSEEEQSAQDGRTYYTIQVEENAELPEIGEFHEKINIMAKSDSTVLELAATYDAFRDLGADHDEALVRLKRKKGSKCEDGRQEKALKLLNDLGLETE